MMHGQKNIKNYIFQCMLERTRCYNERGYRKKYFRSSISHFTWNHAFTVYVL